MISLLSYLKFTPSFLLLLFLVAPVVAQSDRPNIVHIFADDLGWGSVGFNNPSTFIDTPNIDALAMGGMRLNRSYASTVCSPSRANLMTGFHNGHASNDRNGNIGAGIRRQDVTVAEILAPAGYRNAVVGKWGWGASGNRDLNGPDPEPTIGNAGTLPANQGFDIFYGYLNHAAAHDYYYSYLWESNTASGPTTTIPNNGGPGGSPEYIHDLTQLRGEELIRDFATGSEPFYLQISFTIPHFDLEQIQTTPALENLAGDVIFPSGLAQYAGNPNLNDKQERYAAMISRMDASIGAVVSRLEDPNSDGDTSDSILENTVIFFTSDNGATPEDGLGAAATESLPVSGGLIGGKRDLYEGGIRMPAIAHWPGRIAAGSSTDLINDLADFQATAAEIAGTRGRIGTDGVSILPTLLGRPGQQLRGHLLFENFENSNLGYTRANWALVQQDYKLIQFDNGTQELYRVDIDPTEDSPLNLQDPVFDAIRDEMQEIAIAEGAGQPDAYAVQFRNWVGHDASLITDPQNWSVTGDASSNEIGTVNETWSARLVNESASDQRVIAANDIEFLGLEVDATTSHQTLQIRPGVNLSARNEMRVGSNGSLQILDAQLQTARWINVADGGSIEGSGLIVGQLVCDGTISPGIAVDASDVPPAGDFDFVVDFSGIDDRDEKDIFYTPLRGSIPQATIALDYGLSTSSNLFDRGFNDMPEEFNVGGWSTDGQLADAIDGNNYMSVKVQPTPGLAVELIGSGFDFFRNGGNSPMDYAILTNVDGFDSSSSLGQTSSSNTNPTRLEVAGTADLSTQQQLEIRLYGWDANALNGHTHITGADLELRFSQVPTVELLPLGSLLIDGDLTLGDSACLEMQIGSPADSDQIIVTGNSQIDGLLKIEFVDGYLPQSGDVIDLLLTGTRVGEFDNFEVVADGVCADDAELVYESDRVFVRFNSSAALLGDVNQDGAVDFGDINPFIQVLQNDGFQAEADVNKDGSVNFSDIPSFIAILMVQ